MRITKFRALGAALTLGCGLAGCATIDGTQLGGTGGPHR